MLSEMMSAKDKISFIKPWIIQIDYLRHAVEQILCLQYLQQLNLKRKIKKW